MHFIINMRGKMRLGKHIRTEKGTIRKERDDALVRNLGRDYPLLRDFDPRTRLGTLKKIYSADSLDKLLKTLRRKEKIKRQALKRL